MSFNLADYAELLEDLSPHSQDALRANWHEATKVFSPRGLDNYLKGASAIRGLGKGDSLVETWIEEAPMVAKEVGEDVVGDLATASLELASRTSGAVIELLLATSAVAANRLGDAELFLKYLQFINTLVAQAPRGVRPMLDKLEVLFQHLTLGGLRRWALWGAHAHRTNYEEQIRISAWTPGSRWRCCKRSARAPCWWMCSDASTCICVRCGRAISSCVRLPVTSRRARAIAHTSRTTCCTCRMRSTISRRKAASRCPAWSFIARPPPIAPRMWSKRNSRFPPRRSSPMQMAVIGVIEDARVEALSIRRFPGLKQLWSKLAHRHARR